MKNNIEVIVKKLLLNKVFAVLRLDDSTKALKVVEALINGGVKNIEITLTTQNPFKVIAEVAKEFENSAIIGVGSVFSKQEMESSINAGASFVVSPIFNPLLIDICHSFGYPIFTGAFSPTEIYNASIAGADIVKVFPANILGIEYFKSILAPMPDLKIMPTGGVSLTNANKWFEAGACAVGVGGALVDMKAINENNYLMLTSNAKQIMNTINNKINK
ncbi:MAG: bifunctional 4-hydroxy-2-oxoglutarate aldolase/2-dehydro-3-deoxy-phosphogluconate aldolase [Bacteroidetes bacterium]|nr:bifunctional 4-hydroxy-2-oxoglutarate aldolase/2-dehydro-3-deoxy-phosphogluconate aldolase [Bacteroidota bacterium]MBU1117036.1 bifunctional 4-hydroxy-2-oxoglutarate aldolase/2-dehydro-3-deoxy-phosphogluconate aldolase [Bacteroidota bacterium]MBU1797631.1 bifunctional 4-hydroxy-2-oxoglutarate aldolase/2-dehydro-3-deoxy-phosphogluconate aldolase [Bacteroidota bacterium]